MDAEKMMMQRRIDNLCEQLEIVKRERDASVEMMRSIESCCIFCKHLNKRSYRCESNAKADGSCWEWRGVQENGGIEA